MKKVSAVQHTRAILVSQKRSTFLSCSPSSPCPFLPPPGPSPSALSTRCRRRPPQRLHSQHVKDAREGDTEYCDVSPTFLPRVGPRTGEARPFRHRKPPHRTGLLSGSKAPWCRPWVWLAGSENPEGSLHPRGFCSVRAVRRQVR